MKLRAAAVVLIWRFRYFRGNATRQEHLSRRHFGRFISRSGCACPGRLGQCAMGLLANRPSGIQTDTDRNRERDCYCERDRYHHRYPDGDAHRNRDHRLPP